MSDEIFGEYAQLYDLLYASKETEREAAYVAGLVRAHVPRARSLIDFGCGTGRHGRRLAALGFDVLGVERSPVMLARARSASEPISPGSFACVEGDMRSVAIGRRCDAVTALFHVVSYQTSDDDVRAAFANARRHMAAGGCFVFDVWHAAAVLAQRPELRVARRQSEALHVTRIAEPTLDERARTVDVAYTLFVEERATGRIRRIVERHLMRYFDPAELAAFAGEAGLEIVRSEEWLTGAAPSASSWGVCYVAVAAADE